MYHWKTRTRFLASESRNSTSGNPELDSKHTLRVDGGPQGGSFNHVTHTDRARYVSALYQQPEKETDVVRGKAVNVLLIPVKKSYFFSAIKEIRFSRHRHILFCKWLNMDPALWWKELLKTYNFIILSYFFSFFQLKARAQWTVMFLIGYDGPCFSITLAEVYIIQIYTILTFTQLGNIICTGRFYSNSDFWPDWGIPCYDAIVEVQRLNLVDDLHDVD